MQRELGRNRIVLLGIGHTNAYVLRQWKMQPLSDSELICVSNYPLATYSGMLPGVLSCQYQPDEMTIDLVRLCQSAGARLVLSDVERIDRELREITFRDRPPMAYDWLSIGIGSRPDHSQVEIDEHAAWIALKPMQTLLTRLDESIESLLSAKTGDRDRALRVLIVGGGVGGIEVSLCLPNWLQQNWPHRSFQLAIAHRGERLAGGLSPAAEARLRDVMRDRGIDCLDNATVVSVRPGRATTEQGQELPADLVIWATGAIAPELLSRMDLPKDERGFLQTYHNLTSLADPRIFAVGDSGSIADADLPKAGVYAVRQGPVLWHNLRMALEQRALRDYHPQRGFLKLVNAGDGTAVADYVGAAWQGKWVWWWKNYIDRKFMKMYRDYTPMEPLPEDLDRAGPKMYCAGCGSKVGAQVLSRVLARLKQEGTEGLEIGLEQADDVALVKQRPHSHAAWTVDYFTSPIQEPALAGRMAALHAASDLHAKGLQPEHAVAIVQLPHGDPAEQERWLYESLSGALQEFKPMNCRLVGGHTIESDQFALGFSLLANANPADWLAKATPQAGDLLLVTKALGTGILFAAHSTCECRGEWWQSLVASVLQSNAAAGRAAREAGAHAVTDITGFGLAGHLFEMLSRDAYSARCAVDQIPILPGVETLVSEGVESSLAPANRHAESFFEWVAGEELATLTPRLQATYAALFDPQTCGGLLIAIPPERLATLENELRGTDVELSCIGHVTKDQPTTRIELYPTLAQLERQRTVSQPG